MCNFWSSLQATLAPRKFGLDPQLSTDGSLEPLQDVPAVSEGLTLPLIGVLLCIDQGARVRRAKVASATFRKISLVSLRYMP